MTILPTEPNVSELRASSGHYIEGQARHNWNYRKLIAEIDKPGRVTEIILNGQPLHGDTPLEGQTLEAMRNVFDQFTDVLEVDAATRPEVDPETVDTFDGVIDLLAEHELRVDLLWRNLANNQFVDIEIEPIHNIRTHKTTYLVPSA